jgi:hypothetical protein
MRSNLGLQKQPDNGPRGLTLHNLPFANDYLAPFELGRNVCIAIGNRQYPLGNTCKAADFFHRLAQAPVYVSQSRQH